MVTPPPNAAPDRAGPAHEIEGLLFDKDGTLFGFQATWGGWTVNLLRNLAPDRPDIQRDLAARLRLDLARGAFDPASPVIAGTLDDSIDAMLPALGGWSRERLTGHLLEESRAVQPVEAVPLVPLIGQLRRAGFALGVATNDSEDPALAQLASVGLADAFDFVAGSDSGYGAKPGPGQCLAFAEAQGLSPGAVAMVGDSTHDLLAARAAGMWRVAVLTGVAAHDDLHHEADVVLPDIGHLPAWLGL
ncbi:MAG: HAD family hydrolase [Pseudomonadota bacterium]